MNKYYKLSKKEKNLANSDSKKTRLFDVYLKSKKEIDRLESIFEELKDSYDVNPEDIIKIIQEKEKFVYIPISIFKNTLAPLEAVVLFLKDHLGFNFHKIASVLNRDDRTIWLTYSNAAKKKARMTISSEFCIPLSILSDRKFSTLEHVVAYLKETKDLSLKQISKLIGKNTNTIWTVYNRYKNKK